MVDLPIINQAVSAADAIIKNAEFTIGLQIAKTSAVADFPWLGWPVISQLFDLVLNWFAEYVYRGMTGVVNQAIIDAQTGKEKADYAAAKAKLHDIAATGNSGDIAAADIEFQETLARLVHFDGSAPAS